MKSERKSKYTAKESTHSTPVKVEKQDQNNNKKRLNYLNSMGSFILCLESSMSLRKTLERCMVVYDWGVSWNLCVCGPKEPRQVCGPTSSLITPTPYGWLPTASAPTKASTQI